MISLRILARYLRRTAVAVALAWLAASVQAQEAPISLLADHVQIEGGNAITARGNVEVVYQGNRLNAAALRYDRTTGRLDITGPITLDDGAGVVVLADSAALDADLRNGILQSARLVLEQQVQLAATEINRVNGRYTQLYRTVASSCEVCAARPVPLWQIRAERVIHDQEARQLYFHHARLELGGLPVMYLPRLRLPDPTVRRASGFLVPSLRANSQLGTGMRLPYFLTLGDHADVTLTPYVSARTRTLQARLRRAFAAGDVIFDGAISRDDLQPGETRAYLFGEGSFALGRDFDLSFALELTSDEAYLLDYGYSGADRLENEIALDRVRRDELLSARLINIRTLRASEIPTADQLPFLLGTAVYERRFTLPAGMGGDGAWRLFADGYGRESTLDQLGRDGLHIGASAEWGREWRLNHGVLARLDGQIALDSFAIWQDSSYAPLQSRITPTLAAELRWPLARSRADGGRDMIEPIAQIAWSQSTGATLPNEDSTLVEFDMGNLLDLSRFPGHDRVEQGLRAALGASWSHYSAGGHRAFTLAGARVLRGAADGNFSAASGLSGVHSDWLLGAQIAIDDTMALTSRNLIGADLELTKSETRLDWQGPRFGLGTAYSYVIADSAENRPDLISEWLVDGSYRFNRHWTGKFEGRYDFAANQAASAQIGMEYRNECLHVDLSLSRRFTSSSSLQPTTDVSFTVGLSGFGGGEDARQWRRSCGG